MRRIVAMGVVALLGSLGLTGCSSSTQSYGVGYSVGQSLAAGYAGYAMSHRVIVNRCIRQWRISGSNVDSKPQWVNGCVRGFLQVEAEVGTTIG